MRMEELLKQVADGKVDYTVVQDTILAHPALLP
jgi:membrane-bound lytic murein transglycosylase MltF